MIMELLYYTIYRKYSTTFLGALVFVLDIVPCFSKKVSKSVFQSIFAYPAKINPANVLTSA